MEISWFFKYWRIVIKVSLQCIEKYFLAQAVKTISMR